MEEEEIIQIEDNIPCTHNFIYKNKKYPFKFDFFKYSSNYFAENQEKLEGTKFIPLVDDISEEDSNLCTEGIQSFIKYVQHEPIKITKKIVHTLNYLALRYEVPKLQESTINFIKKHKQELLFEILMSENEYSSIDKSSCENILAENLVKNINDPRMLDLKLEIIYRVISKYNEICSTKQKQTIYNNPTNINNDNSINNNNDDNNNGNNNEELDNMFEFLFKCLDKYGQKASILFSGMNFGSFQKKYIMRLMRDYSKVFDFHFIDPSIIHLIYESDNSILCKKISDEDRIVKLESSISNLINELKDMKASYSQLKAEHDQHRLEQEKVINQLREEIENNKVSQELLLQKQQNENEMSKLNKQIADSEELNFVLFNNLDKRTKQKIFNQIEGRRQLMIINMMKKNHGNDEEINKMSDFLSYLSEEASRAQIKIEESNFVFVIPDSDDDRGEFADLRNIGISYSMTKVLFSSGALESPGFSEHAGNFTKIFIEVYHPSDEFEDIYNKIISMKQSQQNLRIAIFVSGTDTVGDKFRGNNDVNCIRLDNCVKKIECLDKNGSFKGCKSLEHILIPPTVTEIGNYAFTNCTSLKSISIPSTVTQIGDYAFLDCTSLSHISIPQSVTSIGAFCFGRCSSLVEVSLPSSITAIKNYTFYSCKSLKYAPIPISVTKIGQYAFQYCSSLVQVAIPSSVIEIENYAFDECKWMVEVLVPKSVKKIGQKIFRDCPSLARVTIPSSLFSDQLGINSKANVIKT